MKNLKLTLIILSLFFTSCDFFKSKKTASTCPTITVSSTSVCSSNGFLCNCELSTLTLNTNPNTQLNSISNVFLSFNGNLILSQSNVTTFSSTQSITQGLISLGQLNNELEFRSTSIQTQNSSNTTDFYSLQFNYIDGNGNTQTCLTQPFQIRRVNGINSNGINLFYHLTPQSLSTNDFNKFKTNRFYPNDVIVLYEANSDIVSFTLELEELDAQGTVISTTAPQNIIVYHPPADNNLNIKDIFNIIPAQVTSRFFKLKIHTTDCDSISSTIIKEFTLDYRVRPPEELLDN